MKTSSSTMTPRMTGVSRLGSRRSSMSSLVMIALDDTPVIPAMISASRVPQPTNSPNTNPSPKLIAIRVPPVSSSSRQVAVELVLVELQPEAEQQEDQSEDRDELDIGRREVEREQMEVRARDEPDHHVDRDGRQPDELAEPSEHIRDEEQDPEDDEFFTEVHVSPRAERPSTPSSPRRCGRTRTPSRPSPANRRPRGCRRGRPRSRPRGQGSPARREPPPRL